MTETTEPVRIDWADVHRGDIIVYKMPGSRTATMRITTVDPGADPAVASIYGVLINRRTGAPLSRGNNSRIRSGERLEVLHAVFVTEHKPAVSTAGPNTEGNLAAMPNGHMPTANDLRAGDLFRLGASDNYVLVAAATETAEQQVTVTVYNGDDPDGMSFALEFGSPLEIRARNLGPNDKINSENETCPGLSIPVGDKVAMCGWHAAHHGHMVFEPGRSVLDRYASHDGAETMIDDGTGPRRGAADGSRWVLSPATLERMAAGMQSLNLPTIEPIDHSQHG